MTKPAEFKRNRDALPDIIFFVSVVTVIPVGFAVVVYYLSTLRFW